MATGRTIVPNSLRDDTQIKIRSHFHVSLRETHSSSTMKDMLQQKIPHKFGTFNSSIRLWIDEQIHRRRCDSNTEKVSGTTVLHFAFGQKSIFRAGNVRIIRVERNRSSPASSDNLSLSRYTHDARRDTTYPALKATFRANLQDRSDYSSDIQSRTPRSAPNHRLPVFLP